MAASFLRRGVDEPATFSLYVRTMPESRGYLVAAGLEDCLAHLEQLSFDDGELAHLATLGFDDESLGALAGLRFTGEVWAVPEGRVVLADEPLLEVTAPAAEAQLVETFLLNQVAYQTTLATKAARCRWAAADRIELVDFSFRRTHGVDAAMTVARVSALAGFAGTSNVAAARRYGLAAVGTMAHSYVEAFGDEAAAFRAFARDFPGRTTFLVDTYDTLEGVRTAIGVIRELGLTEGLAVRLDSGDLAALAGEARALLDAAGLYGARIVVSGGLDEFGIADLVDARAPVDAAGLGTRLGVAEDAPALDAVYKLVDLGGRPMLKLSPGKETMPGAKQVFRGPPGSTDVLGLRHEPAPAGHVPLLEPVLRDGRRLRPPPPLAEGRAALEADLAWLPADALALRDPVAPRPAVSPTLADLTARARAALRTRSGR